MCKELAHRGLPAADLVLGSDAADAILDIQKVRDLLDKNSGIITGEINAALTKYDGVAFMGIINFGGFRLNLFDVSESYVADNGTDTAYFPAKSAMVSAPGCGHMMYGSVTQIDFGSTELLPMQRSVFRNSLLTRLRMFANCAWLLVRLQLRRPTARTSTLPT